MNALDIYKEAENIQQYNRQKEQRDQYENAMLRLANPQTRTIPAAPSYMTPQELQGVIIPEAQRNALAQVTPQFTPPNFQTGAGIGHPQQPPAPLQPPVAPTMDERVGMEVNKLAQGISPEMVTPARTEVLPFQARNYGELMAMQQHAQIQSQYFLPLLDQARQMGDSGNELKDKLADQLIATGNPMLADFGNLVKKAQFTTDGQTVLTGADIQEQVAKNPEFAKSIGFYGDPANLGARDVVTIKTVNGKMSVSNIKSEPIGRSTVSKDYWTKGGNKAVIFDPTTRTFFDVDGNELKSSEVERIPPSAKSTSSATSRAFAGPAGTGILREYSGRWYELGPNGEKNYLDSKTVEERFAKAGANRKSYEKQVAQHDALESFVSNLSGNVTKLKELVPQISRLDSKLLNIPLREFKRRIKGSANEAILSMLFQEISTEANKIASGAQQSVASPPASMTEKWSKIHDESLPIGELIAVADMTDKLAKQRLETVRTQVEKVGERVSGTEKPGSQIPKPDTKFKLSDLQSKDFKASVGAAMAAGKKEFMWKDKKINIEKTDKGVKITY